MLDVFQVSGLGVVGRELSGETSCGSNPEGKTEADLFNAVDGGVIAKLQWQEDQTGCRLLLSKDGSTIRIGRGWDFPETESEALGLVYYEFRAGFARVLENRQPPGLWVRVENIPDGRLHPWIEKMTEYERNYRGYDGQELHAAPSAESPVLVVLRDRELQHSKVHRIAPTGSRSGDWVQFEAAEYDGDFEFYDLEHSKATGERWKGWLRLVDERGKPAFWFYTRD